MKISERTKREMIIFLIVAMGFIWLALSLENNYQNQRLEELKIEKQELEIRNEELFQIIYEETTDSVRAEQIPVQTGGDDVPDTVSGIESQIREISAYNLVESQCDSVESQIRAIAKEQNFRWTDYLVRLAKCESTLNPNAKNVNKSGSVDRGVFQINDYWHKEVSDEQAYNLKYATEWTIKRINEGHQKEWVCDAKI